MIIVFLKCPISPEVKALYNSTAQNTNTKQKPQTKINEAYIKIILQPVLQLLIKMQVTLLGMREGD